MKKTWILLRWILGWCIHSFFTAPYISCISGSISGKSRCVMAWCGNLQRGNCLFPENERRLSIRFLPRYVNIKFIEKGESIGYTTCSLKDRRNNHRSGNSRTYLVERFCQVLLENWENSMIKTKQGIQEVLGSFNFWCPGQFEFGRLTSLLSLILSFVLKFCI